MNKIKSHLKCHYISQYNPNGKLNDDKIRKLLDKNKYSKEKIEKRKRDYEQEREAKIIATQRREVVKSKKKLCTPTKRRKKHSQNFVTPALVKKRSDAMPKRPLLGLKGQSSANKLKKL